MKKILLALGLLAAVVGTAGAQTAGTNTVERNGYFFNATTGQRVNADGSAYIEDGSRDRDLDYYAPIISSTTLDSGTVTYSGVVDLRNYTSANLHIKVVFGGAADTTYAITSDYAISAMSVPSGVVDWSGVGVGIPAFPHGNASQPGAVSTQADTAGGWWGSTPWGSPSGMPGERLLRFRARTAANKYANIYAATSQFLPLSQLLPPGTRVRYLLVQLRCTGRASASTPSVRVDCEAVR